MREKKFRAWDKFNGCYWYSDKKNSLSDFFAEIKHYSDGGNEWILEDFTGLKDQNGKEIYEGDIIIAHEYSANYPLKYVVVFNEIELGFRLRWEGRYKQNEYAGFYDAKISEKKYKTFEVAGNIYENHEILK